jgi:hypothetical protein
MTHFRPYKLKHKPTGLYYQPISHRGSHFSKRGKIYQTKTNILNLGYYVDGAPRREIVVSAHKGTLIYKEFKDSLIWFKSYDNKYLTIPLVCDWEIEEI